MKTQANHLFNIKNFSKYLTSKDILACRIGIEREGLRVNNDSSLALTPHPKTFGNKLQNPFITTDFSESQVEIVTSPLQGPDEVYRMLSDLTGIVQLAMNSDELFWPQSIPGLVPDDEKIPIARYEGGEEAEHAMEYRRGLVRTYGAKKQLISGIHFNYSFDPNTLEKLRMQLLPEGDPILFKNAVYLKVIRNYLRYRWLIIYLTGASVGAEKDFTPCLANLSEKDGKGALYSKSCVSLRNSDCGYKNPKPLFPNYNSVDAYISDLRRFISEGYLSEAKELYAQIRMKAENPKHLLESLGQDGIQYVEIRTLDLNPFSRCGISKNDISFLQIFMIWLLLKEESDYPDWQPEGLSNEEKTASHGSDPELMLTRDGRSIKLRDWADEIISEIDKCNHILKLSKEDEINKIKRRIAEPQNTYFNRLRFLIKKHGYIDSQLILARQYKNENLAFAKDLFEKNDQEVINLINTALPQR